MKSCAVIPVLALVPHLRSPPLSGAGASGFSAGCYIVLCNVICAIAIAFKCAKPGGGARHILLAIFGLWAPERRP